eukprot:7384222-Prymnesium_polylepis.2
MAVDVARRVAKSNVVVWPIVQTNAGACVMRTPGSPEPGRFSTARTQSEGNYRSTGRRVWAQSPC